MLTSDHKQELIHLIPKQVAIEIPGLNLQARIETHISLEHLLELIDRLRIVEE